MLHPGALSGCEGQVAPRIEDEMTRKAVFIAGVGHSGSTVLGFALGAHPSAIYLGEMYSMLLADRLNELDKICSCTNRLAACEYWGPVSRKLREEPVNEPTQQYQIMIDSFFETFGEDRILVDSSKGIEALNALRGCTNLEVKVIYIIRDVRAWTTSMRNVLRRNQEFKLVDLLRKFGLKGAARYPKRWVPLIFQYWYRRNRTLQKHFLDSGIEVFQVGYEDFSAVPVEILPEILEYLDLPPSSSVYSPIGAKSHVLAGNRNRLNTRRLQSIGYDNRWHHDSEWLIGSLLMPHIVSYSNKQTYGPTIRSLWEE